jgi:hypothetical protein
MPKKTRPIGDAVTQFQPGDSSMVKMLKVTRWALLRGGTFTATELQDRFATTKSMAYTYTYAWRAVFGKAPPLRAHPHRAQAVDGAPGNGQSPKRIDLSTLL